MEKKTKYGITYTSIHKLRMCVVVYRIVVCNRSGLKWKSRLVYCVPEKRREKESFPSYYYEYGSKN